MIRTEMAEYLWFVDESLDGMLEIVEDLGDELANTRPDLPGANAPYAILTHCLGVMAWWGGEMVAGRTVERDRPAEFTATGAVADLRARVRRVRDRFVEDLDRLDPAAPPAGPVGPDFTDLPYGRSQSGVLWHVYQELAQHRGQLELTRDVLRAARRT